MSQFFDKRYTCTVSISFHPKVFVCAPVKGNILENPFTRCRHIKGQQSFSVENMSDTKPKTFSLTDYDAYGFDLDGCLLKYKWKGFFEVCVFGQ